MRYLLFAIIVLTLTVLTGAAQADAVSLPAPWLDMLLERGVSTCLVFGGAWFLAFKAYPDGKRFSERLLAGLTAIDHKLDRLLDAFADKVNKDA